jgi:4-alpha-glucanotransferase
VQRLRQVLTADDAADDNGPSYEAVIDFLFRTPARLVSFGLDDLMGLERQINMPGTYREYPNWRHCVRFEPSEVKALLERVCRLDRQDSRLHAPAAAKSEPAHRSA